AHVAQAYAARQTSIPEHPAPSEIGGYALTLDQGFSASVAAAGGMMLQVNTRGEPSNPYIGSGPPGNETYDSTTPLGVVRFGRGQWDTRLGPGDGWQTYDPREGVSFAPTFLEGGSWTRLASLPDRYHGSFSVEFTHPLLVRAAVDYTGAGPSFRNEFIITPDGIVSVTTGAGGAWGMTVPLNAFDGE